MSNGDTDQDLGEEDRQKYDLYSEEEEQEIFAKFDELALAGQLDSDSIRRVLGEYGLSEDDFPIPEQYIQKGDDAYVPPETGDSGNSDPTDYSIYETGLNAEDGSIIGGGISGSAGDPGSGGGSGGGSVIDDSNEIDTRTGGGGMREFPPGSGVFIPEGMLEQARILMQQGVGVANLANALGLESTNINQNNQTTQTAISSNTSEVSDLSGGGLRISNPVNSVSEVSDLSDGGLRKNMNDEIEDLDDVINNAFTGGETSVTTGETNLTTGETNVTGGAVTTGPVSTDVSSAGGAGGAGGSGGSGGTGGNVTVNFGDGTGGGNAGYEKFFEMINSYIASGEPIKEGEVKGIYEQFIETSPQSADAIRSFLALDRPVSEEQAELKTDIYGNVIEGIRDAQSDEMKSLIRRSDMLGAEAESLMGPLSFLDRRDADQLGLGQAVAGGRGLGNVAPFLADRQRAERRDQNLQLAGDLLGQQRATNQLMTGIESGIYSQMAPDIGLDFGQMLGISGVDVQNILGESQSARAARAAERGANIKLGIEAAPVFAGAAKGVLDFLF
jgi:hypothetical protein